MKKIKYEGSDHAFSALARLGHEFHKEGGWLMTNEERIGLYFDRMKEAADQALRFSEAVTLLRAFRGHPEVDQYLTSLEAGGIIPAKKPRKKRSR